MADFSSLLDLSILQSGKYIYHYAYKLIQFNSNLPFARLRYSLGGDRPSQTNNYTLSKK